MAVRTLILAGSPREGGHYAKRAQLPRWTYRVVYSAGQVRGLPYSGLDIHVLPSFAEKPNRGTILAALRYKRGAEFYYVDPADMPTLEELESEKQATEIGELTDADLETAYDAHSHFDHQQWSADRRRDQIAGMTDDELAELLRKPEPTDSEKALQDEVVKEAVKPKPRAKPKAPVAAENFFGD